MGMDTGYGTVSHVYVVTSLSMCSQVVKELLPDLESEVFDYICGVLESPEDFDCSDDVFDAVGGIVLGSTLEDIEEGQVRELCDRLYAVMKGEGGNVTQPTRLLEAPVNLGQKVKNTDGDISQMNGIWMAQPDSRTTVDQRKLERVDAKLKQKLEKRVQREQSATTPALVLGGPTTNQSISRQLNRTEGAEGGARLVYDVKIENFDISYGNNSLLSGATLSLVFGRRYGLVGRNGIGKTTLLRSIANRELRLPSHLSVLHVEQEVTGDDTPSIQSVLECDSEREKLLHLERELQKSPTQEVPSSGADILELSKVYERLQEIDADQAPARAAAILAGLGFTPAMQERPTREFSGGWRMRLALAKALFAKPDLLLLDEPSNMLDIKAIIWLENYLLTWNSTLLVVSHDRKFLNSVCTDIVHMHSQCLDSYRGNYDSFVQTREEKLKSQQREYEAQMMYRKHLQDFVDRWRYNAKRAPQAQSKLKILEKLPELKPVMAEPEVVLRFPDTDKLSPPILQLSEVSFAYSAESPVFSDMSISADLDSRIALVGENGSGKTTLVKLLTDELSPQQGARTAHRNLRIAYFSQHHVDQLVMDISALELMQQRFPGCKEEEYRHQLGSFGVTGNLALRPILSLSGGQKSRLAFALMAMTRPNFLIMDEPTNHLDVETVEALGKALHKFKGGVVLVSHDEHLIELACSEVWLCKEGRVHRLEGGLTQYKTAVQAELKQNQ